MAYTGPLVVGLSTSGSGAAGFDIDFTSSGRASGDLMFVAVETANQAITAPTGFTEVPTYSPQGQGTAGNAGAVRLTIFSKVSDGTETLVSIADSGNHQFAVGIVVDPSTIEAGAGNTASGTTSCVFGGVTTSVGNCLILNFGATDRDNVGPNFSGQANANLTNLTEQFDAGTTTAQGGGLVIYSGEKEVAGATGNTTATQASSANYCWITLALKSGATTHTSTGSLTGQGSTISGTSAHIAIHASSGVLAGQGATISGSAAHIANHIASGALIGAGSTIAGTSARFRVHAASGALTGQGATLSGAATRFRAFASAGTLIGNAATIAGSAARASGAVTHSATGVLLGQDASLTGISVRYRQFASGGALVGSGSVISGVAARVGETNWLITPNPTPSEINITLPLISGSFVLSKSSIGPLLPITSETAGSPISITPESVPDVWEIA